MATVTIHSDCGAQGNKVCHCFHILPIFLSWCDGMGCRDLCFWMLSFKPDFSLSFVTLTHQASLSITSSRSLLKLMSIELVTPSNHLILCRPLLLLPSIFPSIRVFSSESALYTRWWKYWSFNFSITPSSEYSGLIPLGWTGLISLQSKGLSRVFSSTAV